MMRYTATFQPQAWQNDYVINVDAEGPTTWDCTDFVESLSPNEREKAMVPDSYESDDARTSKNTPKWVREWSGPFYVTIEEAT